MAKNERALKNPWLAKLACPIWQFEPFYARQIICTGVNQTSL